MERVGVCVNMEKLKGMERLLVARMQRVEQASHRAAGRVFQLTSAPQVRAILYDELQLDSHCNVKIRETICKGAKSTSETMVTVVVIYSSHRVFITWIVFVLCQFLLSSAAKLNE